MPSQKDIQVATYAEMARPTFWQRCFSPAHRMTRRDFALVFLMAHLFLMALAMLEERIVLVGTTAAMLVAIVLYFSAVLYAAAKRCRDMGIVPWWSVLFVFTYFGLFALLCFPGTKGANEYGPSPRRGAGRS